MAEHDDAKPLKVKGKTRKGIRRDLSPQTLEQVESADWSRVDKLAKSTLLFRLEWARNGDPTHDQMKKNFKWKYGARKARQPPPAHRQVAWLDSHLVTPADVVMALSHPEAVLYFECKDVLQLRPTACQGVQFFLTGHDHPVRRVALTGYIVGLKIKNENEWHYGIDDGTGVVDAVCVDNIPAPPSLADHNYLTGLADSPHRPTKKRKVINDRVFPDFKVGSLVSLEGEIAQGPFESLKVQITRIYELKDPNLELWHHVKARKEQRHRQETSFDCMAAIQRAQVNPDQSDALEPPSPSQPDDEDRPVPLQKPPKLPGLSTLRESDLNDETFAAWIVNWVQRQEYKDARLSRRAVVPKHFTLPELQQSKTLNSFAMLAARAREKAKRKKAIQKNADIKRSPSKDEKTWRYRNASDCGVTFAPSAQSAAAKILPPAASQNSAAGGKENRDKDGPTLRGPMLDHAMKRRFEDALRYLRRKGRIIVASDQLEDRKPLFDGLRSEGQDGTHDAVSRTASPVSKKPAYFLDADDFHDSTPPSTQTIAGSQSTIKASRLRQGQQFPTTPTRRGGIKRDDNVMVCSSTSLGKRSKPVYFVDPDDDDDEDDDIIIVSGPKSASSKVTPRPASTTRSKKPVYFVDDGLPDSSPPEANLAVPDRKRSARRDSLGGQSLPSSQRTSCSVDEADLLPSSSQTSNASSIVAEEQAYVLVRPEMLYEPIKRIIRTATQETGRATLAALKRDKAAGMPTDASAGSNRHDDMKRVGIDEAAIRRILERDDRWEVVAGNDVVRAVLDHLARNGEIDCGANKMYRK